jgi:threonine dehydrogenase-like Zn-dependent dehydrogenase
MTAVPAIVVAGNPEERVAEAARALTAIALDAIVAAGDGSVAVTGSGFIAEEARRRLADEWRLAAAGERSPDAIIETTGDPGAIVEATRQVRELGRVVLAGEPLGRAYQLDIYSDLHVRGLRLIARGRSDAVAPVATDIEAGRKRRLQTLTAGEQLDASSLWFCVVSGASRQTT